MYNVDPFLSLMTASFFFNISVTCVACRSKFEIASLGFNNFGAYLQPLNSLTYKLQMLLPELDPGN